VTAAEASGDDAVADADGGMELAGAGDALAAIDGPSETGASLGDDDAPPHAPTDRQTAMARRLPPTDRRAAMARSMAVGSSLGIRPVSVRIPRGG
jgi:hypothetical protein